MPDQSMTGSCSVWPEPTARRVTVAQDPALWHFASASRIQPLDQHAIGIAAEDDDVGDPPPGGGFLGDAHQSCPLRSQMASLSPPTIELRR